MNLAEYQCSLDTAFRDFPKDPQQGRHAIATIIGPVLQRCDEPLLQYTVTRLADMRGECTDSDIVENEFEGGTLTIDAFLHTAREVRSLQRTLFSTGAVPAWDAKSALHTLYESVDIINVELIRACSRLLGKCVFYQCIDESRKIAVLTSYSSREPHKDEHDTAMIALGDLVRSIDSQRQNSTERDLELFLRQTPQAVRLLFALRNQQPVSLFQERVREHVLILWRAGVFQLDAKSSLGFALSSWGTTIASGCQKNGDFPYLEDIIYEDE